MPKYKIAICLTTGNHMTHVSLPITLIQMLSGRDWSDYEFKVIHENSMYIVINRNNAVERFLLDPDYADCDFLFFWDADNGLFPTAFDRFMEVMDELPEVSVLSGNYYRKTDRLLSVAGVMLPGHDAFLSDVHMFLSGGITNLTKFGNQDTRGMLGAGCLMVRRAVFDAIDYPWFDTGFKFVKSQGKNSFITEDTWFCAKAEEAGFDMYLDTSISSPHYAGEKCFPEQWHQYPKWKPEDDREIPVMTAENYKEFHKETNNG